MSATVRQSATSLAALVSALLAATGSLAADSNGINAYTASYEVEYRNFSGDAEFGVRTNDDGEYVFESTIKIRGLAARALLGKDPALEGSRFVVTDGRIVPRRFWYEDGTRKGEDNFVIDFNAEDSAIRISGPEVSRNLKYETGLLDRGSLQVELMRDLTACAVPGPYRYVDDEGITTYQYERLDDAVTETGIGEVATIRFAQQREGSSRRTVLWLAPEYAYVPVRIERYREGEVEWNFALNSLSGIERTEPACSGFR